MYASAFAGAGTSLESASNAAGIGYLTAGSTARVANTFLRQKNLAQATGDFTLLPQDNSPSFTMGSNEHDSEKPPHRVIIQSFALGKFEVTQGQWKAVMGSNPTRFKDCGDECPVEQVSWNDIQEYIQRLNQRSGKTYRLPSEAEWEYAARAGSTEKWSFGDNESQIGEYGWYNANSGNKTQRVGQKMPNAFGLYDVLGNVWEWVQDCWHENYIGAPTTQSAWTDNCMDTKRVLRGGSWWSIPWVLRADKRFPSLPDYRYDLFGFRLARTLF